MTLVLDEGTPPQKSQVNFITAPNPHETNTSSALMQLDMHNKNEVKGDRKLDSDAQDMDSGNQKEDCEKVDFPSNEKLDSGENKMESHKLENQKEDC